MTSVPVGRFELTSRGAGRAADLTTLGILPFFFFFPFFATLFPVTLAVIFPGTPWLHGTACTSMVGGPPGSPKPQGSGMVFC